MNELERMITRIGSAIREQEEEQGWNLSQNLYNRDWKKDLAQAKKHLAHLKKMQKQGVSE